VEFRDVLGIEVGGVAMAALVVSPAGMGVISRGNPSRTFVVGWRRMTYGEWKRRRFIPGFTLSVLIALAGAVDVVAR
jgi:hypothetical protein